MIQDLEFSRDYGLQYSTVVMDPLTLRWIHHVKETNMGSNSGLAPKIY